MKTLFVVTAAITAALGLAWVFAPQAMYSGWGVGGDAVGTYMARRYGGLFFGYAVILWMARSSEPSTARTAILAGGAVVATIMAILSLIGVLTAVVGPVVWSVVALEVLLAAGFGYQLAKNG